jgi:hypothetical protein
VTRGCRQVAIEEQGLETRGYLGAQVIYGKRLEREERTRRKLDREFPARTRGNELILNYCVKTRYRRGEAPLYIDRMRDL